MDPELLAVLVARARAMVVPERRIVVGIAGKPGAGKSTLARALVEALNAEGRPGARSGARPATRPWAAYLAMDGFHLPQARLRELGLRERMGAPQTFAADVFADVVEAIVRHPQLEVTAPAFDRTIEEPVPGAVRIGAEVVLVVTEGNYLMLPHGDWARARRGMSEVWYADLDDRTRRSRLHARHVAYGKTPAAAAAWMAAVDEPNARLVAAHADTADLRVDLRADLRVDLRADLRVPRS